MSTYYSTSAVWNWDYYGEGTNILIEPNHGGAARVMGFTANQNITAGWVLELATGTVVQPGAATSLVTIGVATETFASGAHGPVCVTGVVRGVTASGAVAVGQRLLSAGIPVGAVVAGTTAGEVIGTAITATPAAPNSTLVMFVHH